MQHIFDKQKSKEVKGLAILFLLAYHLFESADLVNSMGVNYARFLWKTFCWLPALAMCVYLFLCF